jgi:hypothetical protein
MRERTPSLFKSVAARKRLNRFRLGKSAPWHVCLTLALCGCAVPQREREPTTSNPVELPKRADDGTESLWRNARRPRPSPQANASELVIIEALDEAVGGCAGDAAERVAAALPRAHPEEAPDLLLLLGDLRAIAGMAGPATQCYGDAARADAAAQRAQAIAHAYDGCPT